MTKPKKKIDAEKCEKKNDEKENSAAQDQREKKYYYDDSHGYEIYQPEGNDEEAED